MKASQRGFSLMELMVVLALAGVIIGLGAPSFNQFRLNGRLTNAVNDMLAGIVRARSEAIKMQVDVSICASANPTAAQPVCTDGATAGFVVFRDPNRNCLREAPGELPVTSHAFEVSFGASNPLRVTSNGNCISFAPTGFRQDLPPRVSVSHLVFCDNRGTAAQVGMTVSAARGIIISRTGRAKVTRVTAGSGVAAGQGLSDDISTWADAACP
jgi:prepilin-type N-terminal cleavage/methylation domain-containing protein